MAFVTLSQLAVTKRSLEFRQSISPQDKGAIISTAILAVLSILETIFFAAFSIYIAYKKSKEGKSILKNVCSKFTILLLVMFIMCFIWSTCACYAVSLSHNNLALAVPQSIQILSAATIETCFIHFSWTISFGIIKRSSSRMVFRTMSTLVFLSTFLFYGQAIIYIAAEITKLPVMITINRIWTAIVGAAVSLVNVYLMAIFSFYLMKLNNDLNDSGSSKSSKIANSRIPSTTSVVGEESRKQQRQFRTIARHGIWASLFCVAAVITFALGLIERFNVWVNVIQASVCYWLNVSFLTLFIMKIRLDIQKDGGGSEIRTAEPQMSEEKKSFA